MTYWFALFGRDFSKISKLTVIVGSLVSDNKSCEQGDKDQDGKFETFHFYLINKLQSIHKHKKLNHHHYHYPE